MQIVLNFKNTNLRPMPITSQNELARIKISVVATASKNQIGLSLLFDTGAALNTGYLPYHTQIIKRYPSLVAKLKHFDGSNPFEPIKLCGAITDPSAYDNAKHGILSAVVEYHTPYCYLDGKLYKFALALGNSMSVNNILGIPTSMEGELESRWKQRVYLSHSFQTKFPIELVQTKRADIDESEQIEIGEKSHTVTNNSSPLDVSALLPSAFIDTSNTRIDTISSSK